MSALKAGLLSLLISIAVVSVYGFTQSNSMSYSGQNDGAFERVVKSGEIKCGYLAYPPGFMIDPNTKQKSGIFYELMEKISMDTGIKVNWAEEGSYVSLIESLLSGRIDAICSGLWLNTSKAKDIDFTDPVFFNELGIYVRNNDSRFDYNLNALNDPKITFAVIEGALADQISRSDFPKARQQVLPELSDYPQLLMEVTTKKADATISATSEIFVYDKNNRGKIRKVKTKQPIRVFPNVVFVKKGETELLNFLNSSIKSLQYNGIVDQLINKYEPAPGVLLPVTLGYNAGK